MGSVTPPASGKSPSVKRTGPVCKDCVAEGVKTYRPARHGGPRSPRCVTHHRAWRRKTRSRAHELRVEKIYGISEQEYEAIYKSQGGRCAICQRATGKSRALAVDHNHTDGEIRGCLCSPCNRMIGVYDTFALVRAIEYLASPPARKVFGCSRYVPLLDAGVGGSLV